MEPSVKAFRDSDRREPPNSRAMALAELGNSTSGKLPMGNLRQLGDSGERPAELQTLKETYLLTPRGGFFDARNQNRDPEPSAKTLRESDKPTSPEMLAFVSAQPGTSSKGTLRVP